MMTTNTVQFPKYSGVRCLMMPYVQGDPTSIPDQYEAYRPIVKQIFLRRGDIGFLTIDESLAIQGKPHRGARAKYGRALHTEAGRDPNKLYCWGNTWGGGTKVTLEPDVQILLANTLDNSCALWRTEHPDTSIDGDIGFAADIYPYRTAVLLKAGVVSQIGIFTPHESLPVSTTVQRQFLRIVGKGVHGREAYFTQNPRVPFC